MRALRRKYRCTEPFDRAVTNDKRAQTALIRAVKNTHVHKSSIQAGTAVPSAVM